MLTPVFAMPIEGKAPLPVGRPGRLATIAISDLVVDDAYQRSVSQASARVIRRICEEFDWSKFLPVIVVKNGGQFSIVDGQHRTTAALSIGISEVPCYVLDCSPAEAAGAFAAINGNVTPVAPADVWFAQIAAEDPKALAMKRSLDAASVTVVRRKDGFRVGETNAVKVLRRAYDFYGSSTLTTILQCITECGDGNPGMLFGAVINGIGRAVRTKPDLLANPSLLFDRMDEVNLSEVVELARRESAATSNPVQGIITREVNRYIDKGARHAA